jgi:hypothetical protein
VNEIKVAFSSQSNQFLNDVNGDKVVPLLGTFELSYVQRVCARFQVKVNLLTEVKPGRWQKKAESVACLGKKFLREAELYSFLTERDLICLDPTKACVPDANISVIIGEYDDISYTYLSSIYYSRVSFPGLIIGGNQFEIRLQLLKYYILRQSNVKNDNHFLEYNTHVPFKSFSSSGYVLFGNKIEPSLLKEELKKKIS